jgi:Fic family protein
MLRWEEKEDIVERFAEVESSVARWRQRETEVPDALRDEFNSRLLISWIFHDSALEGEVLTYSEIKAATDRNIVSDVSLIPAYEDIKAFDAASRYALDYGNNKSNPINLELVRNIFSLLAPDEAAKGCPHRKDNPLHRLYYHDIAPPEKVGQRMRKLGEWFESESFVELHPVERAAQAHRVLMGIFPWPKSTGRVSRILSNVILHQCDYPLAVLHSIDRQRYYDALRVGEDKLVSLYLEAVETTAQSAIRVYDEAESVWARRGSRRAS